MAGQLGNTVESEAWSCRRPMTGAADGRARGSGERCHPQELHHSQSLSEQHSSDIHAHDGVRVCIGGGTSGPALLYGMISAQVAQDSGAHHRKRVRRDEQGQEYPIQDAATSAGSPMGRSVRLSNKDIQVVTHKAA